MYFSENYKDRLRISPKPGQDPPPLPEWLQIPYLVPVKGERFRIIREMNATPSFHIIPEMCASPSIQRGDMLYEKNNENHVGTLGTITASRRPGNDDLTYVALTAGHVIPDGQDVLCIRNRKDNSFVELKVAPKSRQLNGRPLGCQDEDPSWKDDCGFLIVGGNDIQHFDHCIPNLNVQYFSKKPLSLSQILDPVSTLRTYEIRKLVRGPGLVVYKRGATSELTLGNLVQIMTSPPQGWYQLEATEAGTREWWEEATEGDSWDEASEDDEDEGEWMGLVKWAADTPFSAPGDSGSLVFALESGVTVPLGIHVGAPESIPNHSVFVCLETFCYEAEKEGWELKFTHR